MIRPAVEAAVLNRLRERTAAVMGEEVTDDNGLMADLYEIGYLRQPVAGYLGAMAVLHGGRIEFFADAMPGRRGLTTNGGASFNYASIHSRLIRDRDILHSSLPDGSTVAYNTGLIVAVAGGLYYSDKSLLGLSRQWDRRVDNIEPVIDAAFGEAGLSGEIASEELVSEKYASLFDIGTPTRVLRVAANWKEKTLVAPYDPDRGDYMDTVLTPEQALAGLAMAMDGLLDGHPQRDIDIIRRVIS